MKISKTEAINELLTRGVSEVIDKDRLSLRLKSKQKLRIKLGIDPTSPNIHIGRAVVLWKLRAFQNLGHKVVFIVGDFTGLIGDTSDKEAERPMLTPEQVKANLKSYFAQAGKIIDKSKAEMHYNSKWLKKLGFLEIGNMANAFGLHEFSQRELIKKRLDAGKRVSLRELLYPLMQGYDSVAVKADVELGGTDQRFNLLAGRAIQPLYKQQPQDIVTMELLEGTDGRKMSSSWGNVINLTDEPKDMFGKVMSLQDSLIHKYFTLATNVPLKEVEKFLREEKHPRNQKLRLAWEITNLYHGKKLANLAQEAFIAQFTNRELPSDIPEKTLPSGEYHLLDLLFTVGLVSSKSEAARMIAQNGVKVNKATPTNGTVSIRKQQKTLLQVGKRKFTYVIGQ